MKIRLFGKCSLFYDRNRQFMTIIFFQSKFQSMCENVQESTRDVPISEEMASLRSCAMKITVFGDKTDSK